MFACLRVGLLLLLCKPDVCGKMLLQMEVCAAAWRLVHLIGCMPLVSRQAEIHVTWESD